MNLFVLHEDPRPAARMLHDQHLRKMILETAQIIDGGTRPILSNLNPRLPTEIVRIPWSQRDNPVIHTAGQDFILDWTISYFDALLMEFEWRFGASHAYGKNLALILALQDRYRRVRGHTREFKGFRLAMPETYSGGVVYAPAFEAVTAYRAYYAAEKMAFGPDLKPVTWRHRMPPLWLRNARAEHGDSLKLTADGRHYLFASSRKAATT